jgi:hypothetical protein
MGPGRKKVQEGKIGGHQVLLARSDVFVKNPVDDAAESLPIFG